MKYSERKLLDYVFENMGDDGHCFHGFFWELGRDWRFDDESRTTVKYSCQVPKIELLKHSEHGHMLSTVIDFPFFTLHIAAYEKCDYAYMIRYGIQEVFVRRSKANRYSCLYIKFRHEDLIGLLRVNYRHPEGRQLRASQKGVERTCLTRLLELLPSPHA